MGKLWNYQHIWTYVLILLLPKVHSHVSLRQYQNGLTKWYYFHDSQLNYNEALQLCRQKGWHMLLIQSDEERKYIADFVNKNLVNKNKILLGCKVPDSKSPSQENWKIKSNWECDSGDSEDLHSPSYLAWNDDQPNGKNNKRCLAAKPKSEGKFHDVNCDSSDKSVVCQRNATDVPIIANCPADFCTTFKDFGKWNNRIVAHDLNISSQFSCDPAHGSTQNDTVTCTATDNAGYTAVCEFVVTVDRDASFLTQCSANLNTSSNQVVTWNTQCVDDDLDSSPQVSCDPKSSSTLQFVNDAICTAADNAYNAVVCTLMVTVGDDTDGIEQMEYFEQQISEYATTDEILIGLDTLILELLTNSTEPVSFETESLILQEFMVIDEGETYSLSDGNSTTEVSISGDVSEYGSSMTLGILKSAHDQMNLSHLNVLSQQENVTSYEFGSKINGINMFGPDDELVSLRDGARIEIALELLPRETPSAKTTTFKPVCYYFNHSGIWSEAGCNTVNIATSRVTCSCDHMTSFAVLMQLIDIEIPLVHRNALHNLTGIGIAVSSVCLIITLAIFVYLRMYRKPQVVIHANLALSILIGQLIFVFGIDAKPTKNCTAVTVLLHYTYTAVFMWMLMEGVFLYIKMKPTLKWSLKPKVCMPIAWGIPGIITLTTFGIRYPMYGSNDVCWLPINRGVIYAFVGPALLIIAINTVILYLVLETFKHLKTIQDKNEKERFRAIARALIILEPLLGLTWVFGVLQFDMTSAVVFSYLFVIFNTSQGVFILLWQCLMDDDVAKAMRRRFGRRVDNDSTRSTCNNVIEMARVQTKGQ